VSAVLGTAADGHSFAGRLLDELSATGCIPSPTLLRYYVRPKGVVVLVTGRPDERGAVVRLPLDDAAERSCLRHHAAIEALAADPRLPPALRRLFPRPIAHDRIGGQAYFVESGMPGEAGRRYYSRSRDRYHRALGYAARVLRALRRLTEQRTVIDDEEFVRLCGGWLGTLRTTVDAELAGTLERVERCLRRTLVGTRLPLGWHHGDFNFANLLYAPDDTVTGILDFEVFDPLGLPLIDLLLILAHHPIRRQGRPIGTLFTGSILTRDLPPVEAGLLADELGLLGADDELYRALALCCWLGHLRLRRDSWLVRSPAWLDANLRAVLTQVRRIL
jgi:aminoglycoside phosphotransferase (APT) family kinase protein